MRVNLFMKKNFKLFALCIALFALIFALTYALGVATRPKPLQKASFVWWPETEESFDAANKWAKFLKDGFKQNGYDLKLVSAEAKTSVEYLISSDIIIIAYPIKKELGILKSYLKNGAKVYLWSSESPIIMKQPVQPVDAANLEKIFTWRRDLVDNKKTFFVPLDTRLGKGIRISKDLSHKRILMTQVAWNSYHYETPSTLYYKRREATLWWLKNHPGEYEFYGKDWPLLLKQMPDKYKPAFERAYKGYAPDKIKAVSQAWFALAFENTRHLDYVSEKIYDVMKAGTVPIYLGAPNIEEFVPKDCFINYADFENDEELYAFIKQVTPERYQHYLTCIQHFFDSEKIYPLTPESIADSLLNEIF